MPIAYPDVLQLTTDEERFVWTDQRAMLYALGIGLGSDPLNEKELPFVYENGLKAVPTFATVITFPIQALAKSGVNFARVVHGEQAVTFHRTVPPEGEAVGTSRVKGVYDKGADKGAILIVETALTLASGEPLVTLTSSIFARGAREPDAACLHRPPARRIRRRPARRWRRSG